MIYSRRLFALLFLLLATFQIKASETVDDAAKLARSLVDNNSIGVIATKFPSNHSSLPDHPFALQEYYGGCFSNGSLALLMFPISQSTKNIFDDSNPDRSATLTVHVEHPAAAKPRVALMGSVNRVAENLFESEGIQDCYLSRHPDAKSWTPSNWGYHAVFWARFDPHFIYYVGGFGGLHYIGNIPLELYQRSGASDLSPSGCLRTGDRWKSANGQMPLTARSQGDLCAKSQVLGRAIPI